MTNMIEETISYDRKKFLIGGVCAALLPVITGIGLVAYPVLIKLLWIEDYLFMAVPIAGSLIFVAPIIAWICVSNIKNNAPINRADIISVSFNKSTVANFWAAVIFNIIVCITALIVGRDGSISFGITAALLGIIITLQLITWALITTPLSFLCAIIFERIVRPKKNT